MSDMRRARIIRARPGGGNALAGPVLAEMERLAAERADIEGLEHHLSPDTLAMLADLVTYFEENPAALQSFKQARKRGRKK